MTQPKLPSVRSVLTSRVTFLALAVVLIAAVSASTSVAANLITSSDIKNNTIQGKDIKEDTITTSRLAASSVGGLRVKDKSLGIVELTDAAVSKLQGATGPKGDTGATGAAGARGPAGPASVISTRTEVTAPNPDFGGLNLVDIQPSPIDASNDNRTPMLTVTLDAGKYFMSATAQFFHLRPGTPGNEDYGVLGTLVNGVIQPGDSVSSDIPDTVPNPGQTTASGIFNITENNTVLTVVGSIRGDREGEGGVAVEILKIG